MWVGPTNVCTQEFVAKPEGKNALSIIRPNQENNINIYSIYEGMQMLLMWLGTGTNVASVNKAMKLWLL